VLVPSYSLSPLLWVASNRSEGRVPAAFPPPRKSFLEAASMELCPCFLPFMVTVQRTRLSTLRSFFAPAFWFSRRLLFFHPEITTAPSYSFFWGALMDRLHLRLPYIFPSFQQLLVSWGMGFARTPLVRATSFFARRRLCATPIFSFSHSLCKFSPPSPQAFLFAKRKG